MKWIISYFFAADRMNSYEFGERMKAERFKIFKFYRFETFAYLNEHLNHEYFDENG